jgi:hypothetical protein
MLVFTEKIENKRPLSQKTVDSCFGANKFYLPFCRYTRTKKSTERWTEPIKKAPF